MTTAARPSPADVARKASATADRQLTTPGTPADPRTFRAIFEQGILASRMVGSAQYVALALATHADATGEIPPGRQPRLLGLVHDTGLHPGQVVTALTALKQRGWLRQTSRRDSYKTADLVLTIPNQVMARLLKNAQPSEPSA